jgi:predicted amidophosphoribosyltransferase
MTFIKDGIFGPVLLHWKRFFKREYNQSEIIANSLQDFSMNVEVLPLLKHMHHTPPQVGLHTRERRENVKNAFGINPNIKSDRDRKLSVFDGVFTTGLTINERCTERCLHGFYNIYAATFPQTSRN